MPSRIAAAAAAMVSADAIRQSINVVSSYDAFRKEFGIERFDGPDEYAMRVALLEKRREEVRLHNSLPGVSWVEAVNRFSDYTATEFQAMLGHSLSSRGRAVDALPKGVSLLQQPELLESKPQEELALAVDWDVKLGTQHANLTAAKDQGSCGSCWAVSTAGALETHLAIATGKDIELSYEQMVDCVPNLQQCGGTGGCEGATSELAMAYVHEHGLDMKSKYKGYQSGGHGKCLPPSEPAVKEGSFVRLPTNEQRPLARAVATQGPVVVSADATNWMSYSRGVFAGCDKDATINHAILLMGYGTDQSSGEDYWLIRNSWTRFWGEKGYIRLLKHEENDQFCGVDQKPLEGVGCKGGPATLPVCGMCGILSDSAYPTGMVVA